MAVNTVLLEVHKELDAKMAPVNNWNLPLFYPGGAVAEHRFCRSECGIFDGGHRKIWQYAGDIAALDEKFSVPVSDMALGSVRECMLAGTDGKIAALYTVCRMAENDLLAIAAPGCTAAFPGGNDLSEVLSSITLLGRKAPEVLSGAGIAAENIPASDTWQKLTIADEDDEFRVITLGISRFGEPGYELIFNAEYAAEIYDIFYRNAAVHPAGINAYESLRIESGTPAWSSELSVKTAGDHIITVKLGRHPVKPGSDICDAAGNVIGKVSSSAFCPSDECAKIIGIMTQPVVSGSEVRSGEITGVAE
jgi:glycine cleavage system aminomethyltransferase T